jgi:ATP-dependent protease HslVU (ClpYQ) peptidase subunit
MTCIVGYVDKVKGTVLIGADSAGVKGIDITLRKDLKVFRNGQFVIGCTSSFRMIQLLRFSASFPDVGDKDIFEYMCTDFINSVRKCFNDGGFMQTWDNGGDSGGTFLVGYKDRLFYIEDDFQVAETIDGFDACGCGREYALGSIYSSRDTLEYLSPDNIVLNALGAAEYFSGGVSSPFHIIKTI